MNIHIYSPQCWMARTVGYCTTCCRRRRRLVFLYEWHPSKTVCGGCGYVWEPEVGRHRCGKRKRKANRETVRQSWPDAKRLGDAIRELVATFPE